jgi:hypothetical protein
MENSAFIRMSILVLVVIAQLHAIAASAQENGTIFASEFVALAEGDFPPELTFQGGGMQIDKSQGEAMLRFQGGSWFHVPLDTTLPESFVIEFDYYTSESYAVLFVSAFDAELSGQSPLSYSGFRQGPFHFFSIANTSVGVAVDRAMDSLPMASAGNNAFTLGVVPIRLEVKNKQAKIFVEGKQAVVLPSADIPRTDVIEFFYGSMGAPGYGYVGNIRVIRL